MVKIDLNADVGEGLNNEALLMPYLNSCNIACGGHAGNREITKQVVTLANHYKVKIGAHPSFPDLENFGRVEMDIAAADLFSSIKSQIRSLNSVLRETRTPLHHIKPHGALYNLAAKDKRYAIIIIEAIKGISTPLKLYAPYGSVIGKLANAENIEVKYEAFADRNYNNDLTLVSRSRPSATINNKEEVWNHVQRILLKGKVKTIDGKLKKIEADTLCVHGDNPMANEILKYLSEKINSLNY